jgi:serine/threonine-protein kinase
VPDRADDDRRRLSRKRRRGWLALLVVLLLTTLAALTGWYYTDGRFTTAPAITTMDTSQAEDVARGAGLEVVFQQEYSESVAKGVVMSASPGPGEKVVKGAQIEATVSQGPERYAMPRVVGLSQAAAEAAITSAQLELGRLRRGYSETVAKGTVLRASQPVGDQLKKGTEVYLTVSAGPRPIKIRNYENKSVADAEKSLKKAGFKVTVSTANSASVPAGQVVTQKPDGGRGFTGDTVALTRSLGPVMVAIPNVRSMGTKEATRVMRAAGFKVKVRPVLVNFLGLGYVAYSKPGARDKAPQGSTITLYTV